MVNIPKINERDEVVGLTTIAEAKANGWWRRISRIFVFDDDGSILLQKRGSNVHSFPGLWDQAAGGHVDEGETYQEAALRETSEELGVKVTNINELAVSYQNIICFEGIYKVILPKTTEFQIDPEEVDEIKWLKIDEFEKQIIEKPGLFVPVFIKVWNEFRDELLLK